MNETGWKSDLGQFFKSQEQQKVAKSEQAEKDRELVRRFIVSVVIPAFEEVKAELAKYGRQFMVSNHGESATISANDLFFSFTMKARGAYPTTEMESCDKKEGRFRSEGSIRSGSQDYTVESITKDEVIKELIHRIKHYGTERV